MQTRYFLLLLILSLTLPTFAFEHSGYEGIMKESKSTPPKTLHFIQPKPCKNTVVNLNTANVEGLLALKGLNRKKAQAIIDYRDIHGPFRNLDTLLDVKGIHKKVLAENRACLEI